MAKVKLELIDDGFVEMLNSSEVRKILEKESSQIANAAGTGYASEISRGQKRLIGKAYTATKEAEKDNMENNTLLKAAGASSWDKKVGIE